MINQYRKTAFLVFGSSARFGASHIVRAGYLPRMFAKSAVVGDLCSACFIPSVSRGLAFSAGGGGKTWPATHCQRAAREHSSADVLWWHCGWAVVRSQWGGVAGTGLGAPTAPGSGLQRGLRKAAGRWVRWGWAALLCPQLWRCVCPCCA